MAAGYYVTHVHDQSAAADPKVNTMISTLQTPVQA